MCQRSKKMSDEILFVKRWCAIVITVFSFVSLSPRISDLSLSGDKTYYYYYYYCDIFTGTAFPQNQIGIWQHELRVTLYILVHPFTAYIPLLFFGCVI